MTDTFDWDEYNISHIALHDVSPNEAEEVVMNDPLELEMQVVDYEERFPQLGMTRSGRILVVVTTSREMQTRVVTAFEASPAYRKFYLAQRGPQYGKAARS